MLKGYCVLKKLYNILLGHGNIWEVWANHQNYGLYSLRAMSMIAYCLLKKPHNIPFTADIEKFSWK
jgi:hypothetical protein